MIHIADGAFEKQILVQVRLQDATDGQTICLANIASRANSIRGLGKAVYAVAAGLVDFLPQNQFPKPKKSSHSSLARPLALEQTQ